MNTGVSLESKAAQFALDESPRVLMCLEGEPDSDDLKVGVSPKGGRFTFTYGQSIQAQKDGPAIGRVRLNFEMTLDREGRYLAVHKSTFQLLDVRGKKPIIRIEYVRDAHTSPCSHVHFHAESGLFTHLLAQTGHPTPAEMQSIHVPTGGDRFRPCVEDFLEFLIKDCRVPGAVDGKRRSRSAVKSGGKDKRLRQSATGRISPLPNFDA